MMAKQVALEAEIRAKDQAAARVMESLMERKKPAFNQYKKAVLKLKESKKLLESAKGENQKLSCQLISSERERLEGQCQLRAAQSMLVIEKKNRELVEEALNEEKLTSKRLKDQVYYFRQQLKHELEKKTKCSNTAENMDRLCERIEEAFGLMKGMKSKGKASKLMELMSTGLLFDGHGVSILQSLHRDFVRNMFKPWKLVYSSDMSPAGSFRTATVAGLSEFFDCTEDNNDDAPQRRMFPSASAVARERQALNKYALEVVGVTQRSSQYGEVFYVNYEKAIRLMLDASGLTKFAVSGPVHLAVTSDGANSFRGRTQISVGIKVCDPRAHHMKTKKPVLLENEEDGSSEFVGVQSSEMCTILIMADARDKSQMYDELFGEFYRYTRELEVHGMPASEDGPYLHPFKFVYPSDLKAAWTTSGRGGNCKMTNHFCHLCAATRDDLVKYQEGDLRCDKCKEKNRAKCYHHAVCDSTTVDAILQSLEASLSDYLRQNGAEYSYILANTKLNYDPTMAGKHDCKTHIDYNVPTNDVQAANEYAAFIMRECRLRSIRVNIHGDIDDWRDAIRRSLALESRIALLEKVKKWKEQGRRRVPLVEFVELLIPCILHLENRVGEKIITMILRKGLDLWSGPKRSYVAKMEEIFRKRVLGTEGSPAHWSLPFEGRNDSEFKISPISGRNETIRTMINKVNVIIEAAIPPTEADLRAKLTLAVEKYKAASELLNKHYKLSRAEVEQFQDFVDDFFENWVDIFSVDGLTNYIHLLGSGHMKYFLEKFGCLYLYSQQGWEALMGKVQAVLHLNTQRGGKGSGVGNTKSYIYPVMLFILRDLLWKTGEAQAFFQQCERN